MLTQLISYHRISDYVQQKKETLEIQPKDGIRRLLDSLNVEVKLREQEWCRFGIVIDNDESTNNWQAVRNRLILAGYRTIPTEPLPDGTIIVQAGKPIVGIWLMPNNQMKGTLEEFAGYLVPPNDLLWPLAGDVVQRVIERDRRFRESYRSKACLHTWLAWQEEPGTPLRLAITRRYLDANAAFARQFISWLQLLLNTELV